VTPAPKSGPALRKAQPNAADAGPVRLPVLPVSELSEPEDRFACDKLHAKVTAADCIKRQQQAGADVKGRSDHAMHTARVARLMTQACADCAVGREVAERIGKGAAA
jgi:hypothetical protein